MIKLFVYFLALGIILYVLWLWTSKFGKPTTSQPVDKKSGNRFRSKVDGSTLWVQVYETASLEEGQVIKARFQEEEVECILYEQGKKDIHGNELKGIGIAVPKAMMRLAQNIITRLPI